MREEPDRTKQPPNICSRTPNVAKNYDNTYGEYVTVAWGVLLIRPHSDGHKITICTDHNALKWIFTSRMPPINCLVGDYIFQNLNSMSFKADIKNQVAHTLLGLET